MKVMGKVPFESNENLITQTALYVMRCNGIKDFPEELIFMLIIQFH